MMSEGVSTVRPVRRVLALVVAALVAGLALVPSGTGAAAPAATEPAPLRWRKCANGLECTSLPVPVDYTTPDGETVDLALIRAPAREPSRRVGTLVINFGGPGDAGTQTLPLALG